MKNEITIEGILIIICLNFNITALELFSDTREMDIVKARHYFFYMAKSFTKLTFKKIGLLSLEYGRKTPYNHITVRHGYLKIKDLRDVYLEDMVFSDKIAKEITGLELSIIIADFDLVNICEENTLLKKAC